MKSGGTISKPSEAKMKSELFVSKGGEVEALAKKLGIQVLKPDDADLEKVRQILAKGEPLSKIVREQRAK